MVVCVCDTSVDGAVQGRAGNNMSTAQYEVTTLKDDPFWFLMWGSHKKLGQVRHC